MAFFEPPPAPPEPPRLERQPWWGPPANVVGASVALGLIVGRSDKAAITIADGVVYRSGFEFSLEVRVRAEFKEFRPGPPWVSHHGRGRGAAVAELPPELLRYGIEFADGSKATSIGSGPFTPPGEPEQPPAGPLLVPGVGGGDGSRWQQRCWVWPLPREGPLAFVCEWPVAQIPLSRVEIEAALIREAATRTVELWPEDERQRHSGGVAITTAVAVAESTAEHSRGAQNKRD